jgi:hypothetical protein
LFYPAFPAFFARQHYLGKNVFEQPKNGFHLTQCQVEGVKNEVAVTKSHLSVPKNEVAVAKNHLSGPKN